MYKRLLLLIVAFFMIFLAGSISFAASATEQSQEMYDPVIRAKMDLHIKKAKRKNPAKYEIMMERINNNVTGCLSCHADLIEQNGKKNRP